MGSGRVVWIMVLGVFSILSTELSISGILPMVSERFDVTITQASVLVSAFAGVIVVSGVFMPLVFSRFDRRRIMVLVLGVFAVCNTVCAFAPDFGTLLVARTVPAVFHPVYCTMSFVVAAEVAEPGRVTQSVSRIVMGVSAGMILGVPMTAFFANSVSFEAAMLALALMNVVALVATVVFVKDLRPAAPTTVRGQVGILRKPAVIVSIVALMVMTASNFGVYSYLTEFLQGYTGIAAASISGVLLLFGVFSLLGNYLGGRVLARAPYAVLAVSPVLVALVYVGEYTLGAAVLAVVAMMVPLGVLFGMSNNLTQFSLTSVAREAPDFSNGLFLSMSNLGVTFGTVFCGFFVSGMGIRDVFLGGIVLAVAATALMLLRQYVIARTMPGGQA